MRRRPMALPATAFLALASLPALALAQATAEPAKPAEAPAPKPPLATIYGTLNVNFQLTAAPSATNSAQSVRPRNSVSVDSSNLGVRGGLTVNEMVGATYQCETSANVDGINVQGICNRNSRLGLTGPWGTLFYGNWDTPFKAASYGTKADDPFMNTDVFGYQSIMGSPGFGYRSGGWSTGSTSIKGFDIRANNSVAFHSPSFYGLSAKIQYSADEFKNVKGTQNPELFGGAINFDYAVTPEVAVSLLAAYEQHNDGFALVGINGAAGAAFGSTAANTATATPANPSSTTDSAWRVGAGVQLNSPAGTTTVGGLYDQLTLKQDHAAAGAITKYQRGAWQVGLKHRFGDVELRLRYSQADKGTVTLNGGGGSTDGYGASMMVGGLAYFFTPALQTYLYVGQITNDPNAQYTFTIGGSPAVDDPPPKGSDPWAGLLGLRYAF